MQDGSSAPRTGTHGQFPLDVWLNPLDHEQAYVPYDQHLRACASPLSSALPQPRAPRSWPSAFCWTRMHAESGQHLGKIIERKEAERQAGHGLFFWGVGNALGGKIAALTKRVARPQVFFSVMKSKPKRIDVAPAQVLLWTCSIDTKGAVKSLPEHVVVVSRGADGHKDKAAHYALVCHSHEPLRLYPRGSFDPSGFRNLGSLNPRVGASQVTAVLERNAPAAVAGPYQINLAAELVAPYFVRLAGAVPLTVDERRLLDEAVGTHGRGVEQWLCFASQLRTAALGRITRDDLFQR
jgi:hypothetical protein